MSFGDFDCGFDDVFDFGLGGNGMLGGVRGVGFLVLLLRSHVCLVPLVSLVSWCWTCCLGCELTMSAADLPAEISQAFERV